MTKKNSMNNTATACVPEIVAQRRKPDGGGRNDL